MCEFPASGVGIDILPDEVLLRILSHSTLKELIDVTQNVCTRWRRLSHSSELWRDKTFCIDSYSDDDAVLMLQQMPQLRALVANQVVDSSVIEALCDHCSRLTTLELCGYQKMSMSLLERLVQKCANIQSLRIPGSLLSTDRKSRTVARLKRLQSLHVPADWSTEILLHLRPLANGCPQLSRLKVDKNIGISFEDMKYFFNIKCKTLTHIMLPWASHDGRCVVPLLKDCTSLSYLQLGDCGEVAGEAAEAFTVLGRLTNLRTLVLSDLEDYPAGTPALAFESGGLSRLQVLSLSDCDLDDSVLLAVCTHCPELKELYLCRNTVLTTEGLRQLHRLGKLELLDLGQCWGLRGGAMQCVAQLQNLHNLFLNSVNVRKQCDPESILDITSLEVLSLNDTDVDDSFLDRIPEKLTNLRHLAVRGVEALSALDRLQERMPGLHMDRYYN